MLDDKHRYGALIFQVAQRAKTLADLNKDDLKEVLCGIYVKAIAPDWMFRTTKKMSRGELIAAILMREFEEMPEL